MSKPIEIDFPDTLDQSVIYSMMTLKDKLVRYYADYHGEMMDNGGVTKEKRIATLMFAQHMSEAIDDLKELQ